MARINLSAREALHRKSRLKAIFAEMHKRGIKPGASRLRVAASKLVSQGKLSRADTRAFKSADQEGVDLRLYNAWERPRKPRPRPVKAISATSKVRLRAEKPSLAHKQFMARWKSTLKG